MTTRFRSAFASKLTLAALAFATIVAQAQAAITKFDIPAQPLGDSLRAVASLTNTNVLFDPPLVAAFQAPALQGDLTLAQAFTHLLNGTDIKHEFISEKTVVIVKRLSSSESKKSSDRANSFPETGEEGARDSGKVTDLQEIPNLWNKQRIAQAESANRVERKPSSSLKTGEGQGDGEEQDIKTSIPEVLVRGSKSLNMDIKRTRDDPQPWVTFDRAKIEQSGARNLESFLKNRLTMNTAKISPNQNSNITGNVSRIGLRGLGDSQTLILIDGHRATTARAATSTQQPDLNGIPLAAVERIEVLPTTASGIYGGSATGGVINIILRRDYRGAEAKLIYENSFESNVANRRIDVSGGFDLEGGKTSLLLMGSYAEGDTLLVRDRDLIQQGIAKIFANNPAFFNTAFNPPLGATTNIKSANGSPLFGPDTPNFTSVPAGYTGGGGLAPLQANAGRYNLNIAEESALLSGGGATGLVNGPTVESAMATLRRRFGPRLEAFIEASASNNSGHFPVNQATQTFTVAASAPNNPFGQDILVTFPNSEANGEWYTTTYQRRAVGGAIVRLPGQWMAEADYTWGWSRIHFIDTPLLGGTPPGGATLAADIRNGTIDVLRDFNAASLSFAPYLSAPATSSPFRSTLSNATLRLAGPVGHLPGGQPWVSALLEHRKDSFDEGVLTTFLIPDREQTVNSAYLETRLPLVSAANRKPGVQALELQLAGRFDDYLVEATPGLIPLTSTAPVPRIENKNDSVNPTVGLRFVPVEDVMMRASYGTGFLPPDASTLFPGNSLIRPPGAATDPRRGNQQTPTFQENPGGFPNLGPEESESWSAGMVLTPRIVPGLRLSVDFTSIRKRDNIAFLSIQQILSNETFFPERVTRGPNLPGDQPGWAGPITSITTGRINASRSFSEAYDVALDYRLQTTRRGIFDFSLNATRQMHFKTQLTPTTPFVEQVGIDSGNNPLKLAGNASINWEHGPWFMGWTMRHFDSYRLTNVTQALNQGNGGRIASQTYHDLVARYRFEAPSMTLLENTEVQIGVINVFNKEPPFDAGNDGFRLYLYSPIGDPRLATYHVSVKKQL